LTGRPPFQADTQVALMLKHASMPVPPPSAVNPALPTEFDETILRALAKSPAERTPTVDVFRRELMATLEQSPDPERILVGEDDSDSREAIKLYFELKFPNAQVECVADGLGVVAAFDRSTPTVVLLDLCMPGLDGFQVTKEIRAREESRKIPIIILTASGGPEQWKRLAALGADGFLVKPASLDDVVALVRRTLRERVSGVFSRPQVPSSRPLR
jgi:eukaryotic-like serine/threonine-protein kinase